MTGGVASVVIHRPQAAVRAGCRPSVGIHVGTGVYTETCIKTGAEIGNAAPFTTHIGLRPAQARQFSRSQRLEDAFDFGVYLERLHFGDLVGLDFSNEAAVEGGFRRRRWGDVSLRRALIGSALRGLLLFAAAAQGLTDEQGCARTCEQCAAREQHVFGIDVGGGLLRLFTQACDLLTDIGERAVRILITRLLGQKRLGKRRDVVLEPVRHRLFFT